MLDTFLKQTIAVLVVAIFAAILISLVTVAVFIIRPQLDRAADFTGHTLKALSLTFDVVEPDQRDQLIERLSKDMGLNVVASLEPPEAKGRPTPLLSRYFKHALEQRYKLKNGASVVAGSDGRLWVRVNVAQRPLWLSIQSVQAADPVRNVFLIAALAFVAALIAGIALQRRVARPLKALEEHVNQFDDPKVHSPLTEVGVREISAVSEAFNQMAQRLKLIEADRAVMLAGVSHDLRTPLTKLRLSLDMLHDADDELVQSAKRQVDRIESMLVQFLEYARGFEAEEPSDVSLATLLNRAIKAVDLVGKVDVEVTEDLVVSVRQGALIRALGNLMINALRYGAMPVRVSARRGGATLFLEVGDRGAGLEPEQAKALTRPFARGNAARSGDGTGLGLAIVEQAALAHGGTLEFSKANGEFVASLHLPLSRLRPHS
ncbi:ATP-binding protein [Pseudovibrio sp. SPO723]|uniref:ATP-binding protein n=1 Tax=Nesiotobacter zosterae TaxID=392721 RepID=UPI0029C31F98|nr:ATP-binding protein [Pseudovibrio sp. SPO723]MDX5595713.1 ATP-binding protein [Pseudovibrio sp. SPO723]